ncbi:MBL fold metallo-hydrolase [Terrimonas sp.]|uniref:MBL fold metallo-hydrolase n=1 Tax=Terrimonas sp. TaxID=1914338 RepID=UPI000D522570|nr:MBL fold metallo-hydrolase [Terrimonas sp.]PVD51531.1 MBL fold metallo-hydrolase [Terrimonas sp.]
MKIEQIYTGCLAEAAYYIESNGEALIIDPLRETAPYIAKAGKDNATIKYILETHFHADFVSGHIELAKKTGATIVFGPTAAPGYNAYIAKDDEELKLGDVTIKVLHTPGHTIESTTYLLKDEKGKDIAIFTGDTLFIGDVGRPDLVQKVKAEITPDYLAALLFDSLRNKIMPLADDVIVYPGHGAGSACGKNMSKETTDTLGNQKKFNYALRADMSKEEFIKAVTDGLVEPPQYFPYNVLMNLKGGIPSVDDVIKKGTTPLTPKDFQLVWETEEALVIDTRSKDVFAAEFVPGAVFIGLDDNFAPWAGALITDLKQPILLIAEKGREEEAVIRLSRVGYDNTLGYLEGGIKAWKEAGFDTDNIPEITATDFAELYAKDKTIHLLDARKESEFTSQHIKGAKNFPLDFINSNMGMLQKDNKYYIHCAGGYRSLITTSILKSRGFDVVNIKGGFKALGATKLEKTAYKAQATML